MNTYTDSAEGIKIDRTRALQELNTDDAFTLAAFDTDLTPDADGMYDAQAVLAWIGY